MIDRTRLKALLGDEESLVNKFLDIFKDQTPQQLRQLKAGVAGKDWEQVALLAHGIKSQCRYLGLNAAAELAQQIEKQADEQKELQSVSRLATRLEQDLLTLIRDELA